MSSNLHIVPPSEPRIVRQEPRLSVQVAVEISRSPYGRSRCFNLRSRDLSELLTIRQVLTAFDVWRCLRIKFGGA